MTRVLVTVAAALDDAHAYVKGLRGVFRVLATQHKEARRLLAHVINAPNPDLQRQSWPDTRRRLLAHEHSELEVVYALIESFPTTEQLAQRHAAGASQIDALIQGLEAPPPSGPDFGTQLVALSALLSAHWEEEEGEYFPRAQQHVGQRRAESLVEPYERTYSECLARLHFESQLPTDPVPASGHDGPRPNPSLNP